MQRERRSMKIPHRQIGEIVVAERTGLQQGHQTMKIRCLHRKFELRIYPMNIRSTECY